MERQKYISLVAELRQIVVAKALTLLDDHDAAEDVAGEVLMKLWERHEELHDVGWCTAIRSFFTHPPIVFSALLVLEHSIYY